MHLIDSISLHLHCGPFIQSAIFIHDINLIRPLPLIEISVFHLHFNQLDTEDEDDNDDDDNDDDNERCRSRIFVSFHSVALFRYQNVHAAAVVVAVAVAATAAVAVCLFVCLFTFVSAVVSSLSFSVFLFLFLSLFLFLCFSVSLFLSMLGCVPGYKLLRATNLSDGGIFHKTKTQRQNNNENYARATHIPLKPPQYFIFIHCRWLSAKYSNILDYFFSRIPSAYSVEAKASWNHSAVNDYPKYNRV